MKFRGSSWNEWPPSENEGMAYIVVTMTVIRAAAAPPITYPAYTRPAYMDSLF